MNGINTMLFTKSKSVSVLLCALTLFVSAATAHPTDKLPRKPLIVFHLDMNSVALRPEYIRKWLKRAADMGYNAVLWEVEGKVKWKTCPECVSPDAFSKKTFRKLLAYSRSLGLEPIPLLQTVGHAEYVLRHKKYFSFREDPERYDCYATCKPEVRKFIEKWIHEYLRLFGHVKYFHLGGDEAYAFATSPACARDAKTIGKGKLYAEYMKKIAAPLIKRGIRPCIWGDMALKYPDAFTVLPRNFVIWDWNYWDTDTSPRKVMLWNQSRMVTAEQLTPQDKELFPQIIDHDGNLRPFYTADYLMNLGYDVVLSSSARSYGDGVFAGREYVHALNIIGAAKKTVADNLLGTCVTSWAVRIPNYETQETWLYLAPLTMANSRLSDEQLIARSAEYVFGDSSNEIVRALADVGYPFPFGDDNTTGIMWTGMKDSRPAPPGYIDSLIGAWRKLDDGARWDENVRTIDSAGKKIERGMEELDDFIPKVTKGFDALYSWRKAAYFQYWGWVIANDIVRNENGHLHSNPRKIIALLRRLKSDYIHWAKSWMTPASANQNAGLIYDALIDYFSNVPAGGTKPE